MSRSPFFVFVASIFACATTVFGFDEEAQRLADGYEDYKPYYFGGGAGTGALYGGVLGAGLEVGYGQVGLVAAAGMGFPSYSGSLAYGEKAGSPDDSKRFSWRVGLKGYLAGEEMSFRPYLVALYGPVWVYQMNWFGEELSGVYDLLGASAGLDWELGSRRGFSLTLGVEVFPLTRTVPETHEMAYKEMRHEELPFLVGSLIGGLNYRF